MKLKRLLFLVLAAWSLVAPAQIQPYYNDVNLSVTGLQLRDSLAVKIIATHYHNPSYSELWNIYTHTDSATTGRIYLLYGSDATDSGDCHDDLTRNQADHGGSAANCDYNREHVYPKSLGDPDLGTSGPGSDAHHVRPSDVSMNSLRGNKKFADGSGTAHAIGSDFWYPGDRWKGDVARIIMYMYLRYGTQCLPSRVGSGNPVSNDPDMIDLFLQWNAQDPPSATEDRRNDYLEGLQGNRNPFIDNPYLATLIWGGPTAQDRWNMHVETRDLKGLIRWWPNPVRQNLYVSSHEDVRILITDQCGRIFYAAALPAGQRQSIPVRHWPAGLYFLTVRSPQWQGGTTLVVE